MQATLGVVRDRLVGEQEIGIQRPRLLMLTSNFPRWQGDSTTPFVLHMAQDLLGLGWDVDVLAPHAPGASTRELLESVPVERFRYLVPERAETVCYGGGALVNLRENKLNLLKLPALIAAEWTAATTRALRRQYDVIQSHWILPQGFVGSLLPTRTPHVVTIHGGDIFGLQGGALGAAKRFALHRATGVTANSSVTRQSALDLAPRIRRLELIPTGAEIDNDPDPSLVAKLRTNYRRPTGPLLGFVGRIVDEKGYEDFLRAIAAVVADFPDVTGIVVGEGQHRAAAEQLSRDLGIADRVSFLGWVPAGEVQAHMGACDVFIAPSRRGVDGWIEAQGLTVIEALASGVPTIAARSGGIVDTIDDGETGLFVDERAPEQIAAMVKKLCTEPELRERLATRGRVAARERFGRSTSAGAFDSLFRSLIKQD